MTLGPLSQTPLLNNLCGFRELDVLSTDVSTEDLKLAAGSSALEDLRGCAGEGGDALRVGENLEKHGSVAAELLLVAEAGHVDGGAFAVGSSGGSRGLGVVA